ncbi:MAG: hypothetical protein WKF73_03795 [Nocardioidaceae bacterium]
MLVGLLFSANVLAQTSSAIPYQAVARDAVGNLITNKNVTVQLTVLDGSTNGLVLYKEKHNTTTNQFGLFTVAIGTGSPVSGNYNTIGWGNKAKFLKVEFDPGAAISL